METSYIDYKDTNCFSQSLLAYIARDPLLESFIVDWPDLPAFGRQIERKKQHKVNRTALTQVLSAQYGEILKDFPKVASHIQSLKESNTFTVTTGHQLNVFTGPLYFIFKIITTIKLAKDLKSAYPDYNFVPVYWMASEDHDFAEINHTYLLGKKFSWEEAAGQATGRMSTATMEKVVREYQGILGLSEHAEKLSAWVEKAYLGAADLADATRILVNQLFGRYGLVIVDADDHSLKQQFATIMNSDIQSEDSYRLLEKTSQELTASGFSTQISGRPINFFYLTDQFRERIVKEASVYKVLNQSVSFTQEELALEIQQHPERFSPNVVMRPLYQEVLLPNLAYIGGGAEIVYWLQLKSIFDHYQIPFPLLLPRNSAMITDQQTVAKMSKMGFEMKQLFDAVLDLNNDYVQRSTPHKLDLQQELLQLQQVFVEIKQRVQPIDPTLVKSTEAVQVKLQNAILGLEKKLLRAEKRKYQEALQSIENIKSKLFPNGGLQERSENFGLLYVKYGDRLMDDLLEAFDPLDLKFSILY